MKKSKRAKSSNLENGVDFISSMPDPILELILQGLPTTEEVVRTSVLSIRWRYLWTSIPYFPSLNLDCDRVVKHPKKFKKNKFKKFVSWALANETVDLDSFRLRCDSYYTMLNVTKWIRAAITRKVKSLDLRFYPGPGYIVFPDCLVTCDSLESLRLYLYGSRIKLPDCNGFSALKVLELNSVELPGFIEKCLGMCPSLEKLTLIDCVVKDNCYILEISCPKLKTLIIHNHKGPSIPIGLEVSCPELVFFECVGLQIKALFILKKVESLKTAVILPQCTSSERPFCNMARISHVESLSLDCSFVRYACDPESLPNLKTLELTTTFESDDRKLLKQILTCSPNLESIHLISQKVCYGSDWNFLSPCLKRVEFPGRGKWKLDIAGARKCIRENGFHLA